MSRVNRLDPISVRCSLYQWIFQVLVEGGR